MRRPLVAASLTVLLLVAVLRYELTLHGKPVIVAARPAATPPTAPAAGSGRSARAAHHRRPTGSVATRGKARASSPARRSSTSTRTAPARTTPSASHTSARPTGTYTGTPSGTPYGVVQVQIKVTNGRITDVIALQMPSDSQRSRDLSAQAGPQLRQEALSAQSANIDGVSGATYTSNGYKQSLQAAIDQAHL